MGPAGALLERQDVMATADTMLGRIAAGSSAVLLLVGEAGLGKTSLIDRACAQAARAGLDVARGCGDPMETGLPFGLAWQALDGLRRGELLHPDPGGPGGDRAARFFGVLRWLRTRGGGPLLLALDDLHWADPDSLALLAFLARRASSVPLGLVATLRPWPPPASELAAGLAHGGRGTLCQLAPLSEAAAGSLLEARLGGSLPGPARRQAYVLTAGNPLLLEQLAVRIRQGIDLSALARTGRAGSGQGILLSRFAGLPPSGMRCARAASVLGTSFLPEIAVQVAGLSAAAADTALDALGRAGLVDQAPGRPAEFVHPLFRQALYDDLSGPTRMRLHARAFSVLHARGLDALAAEHAFQAGLSGDLEAAAVLHGAGCAARQQGALATAVSWLDAAAAMTGERADVPLLLAQAEALLASGNVARAVAAYQRLIGRPELTAQARTEAQWMLGRALAMTGEHDRSAAAFSVAAGLARRDGDPGTAVEVLLDGAFCRFLSAGPASALPFAAQARELAKPLSRELRTRADADWGQFALLRGDPAGMAAAEAAAPWLAAGRRTEPAPSAGYPRGGWGPVNSFAYCACLTERLGAGGTRLRRGPGHRGPGRRARGDRHPGGRPTATCSPGWAASARRWPRSMWLSRCWTWSR